MANRHNTAIQYLKERAESASKEAEIAFTAYKSNEGYCKTVEFLISSVQTLIHVVAVQGQLIDILLDDTENKNENYN